MFQITKALHALKIYSEKEEFKKIQNDEKLFTDSQHLTLQFTLKKVPPNIGLKFVDV